ncbi:MAG: thiamine pyrophosphate-binding protein [Chloroflexi bacterium]|nr:thiamine pyrophosphate-binding protein [Chloroflexota bacterium]MCI0776510.1 thiamine pyrophosphate-binding protein [Chloroflexota bacterium]MCI0803549.1 thiamine pyrophosphate-binding protein [Chloroflexota bacterium]MCI0809807.1 thiamine pyrophosphate-binding protein [Chloroflexota bacterium]MCI0837939.1 thiamine pyrophosphate-binding protein [Chloroflexota bacterium]
MEVDGSYLLARTLKEEGVEHLFFLMGGPNYEIINNSEDFGIKTIDFRHEQAASMAAHAYARVTGKPGVTTAASGPGTLNLLTGQYTAFVDCAPMITLGGAGPISDFGRDGFQEIDQVAIFEPVSKAVMRPTDPARYPEQISAAFRIATSGRPGPVYIDCNEDVLYGKVEEADAVAPTRAAGRARPAGDPDLVKQAVQLLSEASSPIVFAGGGVWWSQAYDELRQLVERTGIPFYTSPMSRGLIPDDHALSFPAARSGAFRQADVVLVVGTRFNWMMTFGRRISEKSKIIQIDIHGAELGHNRSIEIGIEGDAKAVLQQMIDEADRTGFESKANSKWIETLRQADLDRRERVAPLENSEQQPIHPLRLCKELREVMDRDAILTVDGNEILHYGRQSMPTYVPGHRLNSGPSGCMGVGLPYAIGAKIAKPDKQVVALHGDGSLGMNVQDFDTAVRHNLPMVIVVSNNEGWTARVEGIRKPGRELGFTRFDRVAEALGGHGELVEDPNDIKPALERAFDAGVPAIVNVRTDPTARALSSFVGSKME